MKLKFSSVLVPFFEVHAGSAHTSMALLSKPHLKTLKQVAQDGIHIEMKPKKFSNVIGFLGFVFAATDLL